MDISIPPIPSGSTDLSADEALEMSGWGRFQTQTILLLSFLEMSVGYHCVLTYFIASNPPWSCKRNDTSIFCEEHYGVDIGIESNLFSTRCNLGRDEWSYSTDKVFSVVTEYDLVCQKDVVTALVGSAFHIGGIIGCFTAGYCADRYGRKKVIIAILCILCASSIGSSFISNIWQLILLRGLVGATYNSYYSISYVYLAEVVPPRYRTLGGIMYCGSYVISLFLIDALGYLFKNWRQIALYASFPAVIGIILTFILPESPRWLMVNNKQSQAHAVLESISKQNGKPLSQFTLKTSTISIEKNYTYKHIFQNCKVTIITLSLAFAWFTTAISYYTIAFESASLGGNMYQSFALTSIAEISSKVLAFFVFNRFGRKRSTLTSLVLTGSFAASTIVIPKSYEHKYVLNIILMTFSRMFADMNMQGVYLWTFEVFPTVIRSQGLGVCTVVERIGSSISPFLINVLQPINGSLPYIILLIFTVTSAGCCGVFLPETNNHPTREKYEDIFQPLKQRSSIELKETKSKQNNHC